MPSNQDGQTTCPTCGDTWKRPYYPGDCPDPFHGTGTVPSEAKNTEKVYLGDKMGVGSGCGEVELTFTNPNGQREVNKNPNPVNIDNSDVNQPADSLEQEIPRLLFKSGAIWSVDDPKGDLEDELLALIRRREIALLEKMKREWGYGDTGMDWEEWINAELKRLKEGEKP